MKRTYSFSRIWVIICSGCGENIIERADERSVVTRADAEEYRQAHEAAHRNDEGRGGLPAPR